MSMPGGMEWLLIAFVVLLLFGGKKIPELAKGLGSGIKNFKKAVKMMKMKLLKLKNQMNLKKNQKLLLLIKMNQNKYKRKYCKI